MKSKFSKRLKELRIEKGLSQMGLCKALDNKITYAAISYWEQEKRSPSLDCCIILADFFGVTLDYLAGRED